MMVKCKTVAIRPLAMQKELISNGRRLRFSFLDLKKSDFKKFVYKINNEVVNGYKVNYKDETKHFKIEIGLYNEKFKEIVIKDHLKDFELPLYVSVILIILKFLFYKLEIISKETYKRLKRFLMNDQDELKFIIVDIS